MVMVFHQTRENLGQQVPAFITPGVTTKEDVLMQLGETDNFRPESQLHYITVVERGGVAVVGPNSVFGYHRQLWRTLSVEFDETEREISARLQTELCSVDTGFTGGKSCTPIGTLTVSGSRSKAGPP
jgi:hypothetical protein